MDELVPFRAELHDQTREVSALPLDELRRRTIGAAATGNFDWLWQVTCAYLHLHAGSTRPLTLRRYRYALEELVRAKPFALLCPERDQGTLYIKSLERILKPPTLRVRLAAYRAFYKALAWAGASEERPFEHVKLAPDRRSKAHLRLPYSDDELERLMQLASPLERTFLLLGAHGGLRMAEALNLETSDLDLERKRLRIRSGKGGKERYVSLSVRLCTALKELKIPGKIFAWNDQHARYRLRKLARVAEVDILGRMFHACRHYAGTRLMRQTGNLVMVQEHLGHASVQTASLYTKLAEDQVEKSVGDW